MSPFAQAATREPLAAADRPAAGPLPSPAANASRAVADANSVTITSAHYGPEQVAAVRGTLGRLVHGPELAALSVYLATPDEIAETCGATVLACYLPEAEEMVVSGVDRPVAGVTRAFAIAHEYGHHIANTQQGDLWPSLEAGTIRWATYERVCQFTRARRLFPGNQGAHYWQDPEEAFAESYAHLAAPADAASWQFTSLLRPTRASLAKIQADLERPWSGPTRTAFTGSVEPARPRPAPRRLAGDRRAGLDSAAALGTPPSVFSRLLRTPLDGRVEVSVHAPAGADLAVVLRDPVDGQTVARGVSGEAGEANVSYPNCGRDALRLEIRSLSGGGAFQATVLKP